MTPNNSADLSSAPSPDFYDADDSDNVCFLCDNPRYSHLYTATHFGFPIKFQKCECGSIKQTPMPNEKFFEWFFNSEVFFSSKKQEDVDDVDIWGYYDYFADESSRLATSKRRYNKLKHHFKPGGRIMKIGPATGTFLHAAALDGHDVIGCDVSSRFAQYARDHYHVKIDNGRFERMGYPEGSFDAVMLLNVVENVPNLPEFLAAIRKSLKPGGHFVFNYVPMDGNLIAAIQKDKYFIYRPPICYAFTKEAMIRTAEKYGFRIVESYLDIRYMHLEKMLTLLRLKLPLKIAAALRIHRIPFPVYAYPSRVLVAEAVDVPE